MDDRRYVIQVSHSSYKRSVAASICTCALTQKSTTRQAVLAMLWDRSKLIDFITIVGYSHVNKTLLFPTRPFYFMAENEVERDEVSSLDVNLIKVKLI